MATSNKYAYLLVRNEVEFDRDDETHRRLGVYDTKEDANKAKTMDVLNCLEADGVPLKKETTQEIIKAFTGKSSGFTVGGFCVTEDEVYDNDNAHIAPAYSWEIEKVPKK